MVADNSPHHVYLSYVQDDQRYAARFRELMEPMQLTISSCRDDNVSNDIEQRAESMLTHCSIVVVLIGPKTRQSRWVDLEIALATAPRTGNSGAGLLGIILPEHSDFSMPYYEPENIPLRLHDRVKWEFALIRKWIEDPSQIQQWIENAERRRKHFRSSINYSALKALKEYPWDENADTPRPILQSLSEREL